MSRRLLRSLAPAVFAFGVGLSASSMAYDDEQVDCYVACVTERSECIASGGTPAACAGAWNACKRGCLNLYPGPPPF